MLEHTNCHCLVLRNYMVSISRLCRISEDEISLDSESYCCFCIADSSSLDTVQVILPVAQYLKNNRGSCISSLSSLLNTYLACFSSGFFTFSTLEKPTFSLEHILPLFLSFHIFLSKFQ